MDCTFATYWPDRRAAPTAFQEQELLVSSVRRRGIMRSMSSDHGWVSSSPGDNSQQSGDARQLFRDRRERKGELLAVVAVRVYEHDEDASVSFPVDAVLGVETDQSVISDVVRRAREQLTQWR
jgi:hypothetical protein